MRFALGVVIVLLIVGCQTAPQDPTDDRIAAMQKVKHLALG